MKKILLFILISFFVPFTSKAAEIFFGVHEKIVGVGQQFEIGVFLNTQGEVINAVQGKIVFPVDVLKPIGFRDNSSVLSLWVERPHVESAGRIAFSGIVPGGYTNSRGPLFSFIFQAEKEGKSVITTDEEQVLLNDGKGTAARFHRAPLTLTIQGKASKGSALLFPQDFDAPESFTPKVVQDPTVFDGKWFLVFTTQDKGSGIAYYAIHESRRMKTRIATNQWIEAESPYVLKDQTLKSYVYVKAVDNRGNERIAMLSPLYIPKWYENYLIWVILGIGTMGYLILKKLKKEPK